MSRASHNPAALARPDGPRPGRRPRTAPRAAPLPATLLLAGLFLADPLLADPLLADPGSAAPVGAMAPLARALPAATAQDDAPSAVEIATEALLAADEAGRDAALAELKKVAEPAVVLSAIGARSDAAAARIARWSGLKKLHRIAALRRELDEARASASELIFDRERYFTPYRVPEVSPARANEYLGVQREVDRRVAGLDEAWGAKSKLKLSAKLRAALGEIDWGDRMRAAIDVESAAPRGRRSRRRRAAESEPQRAPLGSALPEWVRGLPLDAVDVTVRTFAWSAAERDRLARDRAVMQHNEDRTAWARKDRKVLDQAQRPSQAEASQVLVTNEYRRMFGVRALAWHPALQAATRGHSDYMAKAGVLSHHQPDSPETRDYAQRAARAGYGSPRGENCSRGLADPRATHIGWRHSSGHHRNLLDPSYTEMASASTGDFWTQNFGDGTVTIPGLDAWRADLSARR